MRLAKVMICIIHMNEMHYLTLERPKASGRNATKMRISKNSPGY